MEIIKMKKKRWRKLEGQTKTHQITLGIENNLMGFSFVIGKKTYEFFLIIEEKTNELFLVSKVA